MMIGMTKGGFILRHGIGSLILVHIVNQSNDTCGVFWVNGILPAGLCHRALKTCESCCFCSDLDIQQPLPHVLQPSLEGRNDG